MLDRIGHGRWDICYKNILSLGTIVLSCNNAWDRGRELIHFESMMPFKGISVFSSADQPKYKHEFFITVDYDFCEYVRRNLAEISPPETIHRLKNALDKRIMMFLDRQMTIYKKDAQDRMLDTIALNLFSSAALLDGTISDPQNMAVNIQNIISETLDLYTKESEPEPEPEEKSVKK